MRQSLTPYLTVSNAAAAIDFYKKAFGAEEVARHLAPDGKRLMHAQLKVLGMDLMLSDDFPEGARRSWRKRRRRRSRAAQPGVVLVERRFAPA